MCVFLGETGLLSPLSPLCEFRLLLSAESKSLLRAVVSAVVLAVLFAVAFAAFAVLLAAAAEVDSDCSATPSLEADTMGGSDSALSFVRRSSSRSNCK